MYEAKCTKVVTAGVWSPACCNPAAYNPAAPNSVTTWLYVLWILCYGFHLVWMNTGPLVLGRQSILVCRALHCTAQEYYQWIQILPAFIDIIWSSGWGPDAEHLSKKWGQKHPLPFYSHRRYVINVHLLWRGDLHLQLWFSWTVPEETQSPIFNEHLLIKRYFGKKKIS